MALVAIGHLVMEVECPKCGAAPGEKCPDIWTYHQEREDAWRQS